MLRFIARRLMYATITLTLVSVLVFVLTDLMPGDWATAFYGQEATPELLAQMRAKYGLDRPVMERYANWVSGVFRGDFGESFAKKQPVASFLAGRLQTSLLLGGSAALVAMPFAVVLGIIAGLTRGRKTDTFLSMTSLIGMSTPGFVVGTILIYIFSIKLKILPALTILRGGRTLAQLLPNIILPVATMTIVWTAYILRMIRTVVIDVGSSDFVQMAILKGMPRKRVILRHLLPSALLPAINSLALMLASLIGGQVIIEGLFNYPGLGQNLIRSISNRDVPLVQGAVLLVALMYTSINLGADLVTRMLDPRLRGL